MPLAPIGLLAILVGVAIAHVSIGLLEDDVAALARRSASSR